MNKPVKVFIVDDHEIVIDGLKSILNPFLSQKQETEAMSAQEENHPFRIVGIADNAERLSERISHLPGVDVIIMDYYLHGINGLDTAVNIKEKFPDIKIILFSMEESDVIITEAFSKNLDGYVTKSEGRQRLLDAIKKVFKGERVFPALKSSKTNNLPWKNNGTSAKEVGAILSKREKEVTCLIANGNTTQQIADALNIAFNTVEVHRNNIYRKLDINRLAELVKYAIEQRLCE